VLDAKKVKINRFLTPEVGRIQGDYVILQDFFEAARKRIGRKIKKREVSLKELIKVILAGQAEMGEEYDAQRKKTYVILGAI